MMLQLLLITSEMIYGKRSLHARVTTGCHMDLYLQMVGHLIYIWMLKCEEYGDTNF